MQKPSDMLDRLKQLRSQYGATMSDDECATLMNDWVWEFRALGYGLSNKDGGTHGHRKWDDEDICHDVVMLKDGTYWDALLQAGAASIPNFDPEKPSGVITDATRYWIAPIEPKPGGVIITPPTLTCQAIAVTEDLKATLTEVSRRLDALTQLASALIDHGTRLADLQARIEVVVALAEQQERRREELAVHADDVIVRRTEGWPIRISSRVLGTLTGTVGTPSR